MSIHFDSFMLGFGVCAIIAIGFMWAMLAVIPPCVTPASPSGNDTTGHHPPPDESDAES